MLSPFNPPSLRAAAFLLGAALAPAALAQPAFPSEPPALGAPRPLRLPETRRFTLPNGLAVELVPFGTLPKVNVVAYVRTGSVDEAPGQAGLAALTAGLLTEGTTTRSAEGLAEAAAALGGSLSSGAGALQTSVAGDGLAEFAPDVVRLVADVLRNAAFVEASFNRLRRDALRRNAVARSQPGTRANVLFRRALYGDHPYGRVLPADSALEALTLADVRRYYTEAFSPQRTRLYVAGRFDAAAVEAAVRSAFGSWPRGADRTMPDVPTASTRRVILLADQPGAAQSNVIVGGPVLGRKDPRYAALEVTDALLGGAFGSRITRNIRENKGYTYSPYSSVSERYGDAYWSETAAVVTASTGAALREILREVDSLRATPPPADELRGIQNNLNGRFALSIGDPNALASQLALLDLFGLPRTYLTGYTDRVLAVSPATVQGIAAEQLDPSRMTIVVVGDRRVVEPQLRELGEVQIVE